MEKNSQVFYYHADGLGSIMDVTNQFGNIIQHYKYSSFGKIESQADGNFVQPYNYTSREFDVETGLYYYRARYYDSLTGRFLGVDPIGFSAGVNFYSYVGDNPTGRIDPFGLDWLDSLSNFSAGTGDFLTGGYMNALNFSERVWGRRAISLTAFARGLSPLGDPVDQCSISYAAGEHTGLLIGTSLFWSVGINGGANSVIWQGFNQGAKTEAQALGVTLEKTPIGGLLDLISNNIGQVPQPIWKIASATYAANASGKVQSVVRGAGEIATKIELPILKWRNIQVIPR
jgi:RHS repeat-associated protein